MPAPYNGGCLCGDVHLTISGEPVAVLSCSCLHCTKGAGGPSQLIAKFPASLVQIHARQEPGEFTFQDTASGNPKVKSFCPRCACTLWTVPEAAKGQFYLIRTPLLDQGSELKPQNEIFTKYRPGWMRAIEGVIQWEEMRK